MKMFIIQDLKLMTLFIKRCVKLFELKSTKGMDDHGNSCDGTAACGQLDVDRAFISVIMNATSGVEERCFFISCFKQNVSEVRLASLTPAFGSIVWLQVSVD